VHSPLTGSKVMFVRNGGSFESLDSVAAPNVAVNNNPHGRSADQRPTPPTTHHEPLRVQIPTMSSISAAHWGYELCHVADCPASFQRLTGPEAGRADRGSRGRMLWLCRNTLSGSHVVLTCTRRAHTSGEYAARTRSIPSSPRS
jgi:hypothetical protein